VTKKYEHVKELCMHVNKTEKDLVVCEAEDLRQCLRVDATELSEEFENIST
jgi:hypothetical protein